MNHLGLSIPPVFLLVLTGVVVVISALLFTNKARRKGTIYLPPGPPGYPLIGNFFDMPSDEAWKTYRHWSQQYDSDIVSVNVLGNRLIVLNTEEAVNDLLEKRSAIYSGRPQMIMTKELMNWGWMITGLDYGEVLLKGGRKLMHQEFHPEATIRYYPQQLRATHELLRRLVSTPHEFMKHIRYMSGAIIMSTTYGIDVLPENDPYIETAERALEGAVIAVNFGSFIVDFIPIFKYIPAWVPGAKFQQVAQYYRKFVDRMLELPYQEAKRKLDEPAIGGANTINSYTNSFVSHCLSRIDSENDANESVVEQEHSIKCTAATMYTAGADTTVSTITSVLLGVLSNPEALKNAQDEIDSVIGKARLPSFSDQDQLPWVTAIVRECLRWNPVSPLAVPHRVTVDDVYRGLHIPAQSVVVGNAWAILHDEKTYPDPFKFKPERFLKTDTNGHITLDPEVKDPATAAFGFGRRICPGRYFAISSTWIAVANILAVFDISKAVDEDGRPVEPSYEYTSGFLCYPKPFRCSIVPRDEDRKRLVEETFLE